MVQRNARNTRAQWCFAKCVVNGKTDPTIEILPNRGSRRSSYYVKRFRPMQENTTGTVRVNCVTRISSFSPRNLHPATAPDR